MEAAIDTTTILNPINSSSNLLVLNNSHRIKRTTTSFRILQHSTKRLIPFTKQCKSVWINGEQVKWKTRHATKLRCGMTKVASNF